MYTETSTTHPNSRRPFVPFRSRRLGHRILGSGLIDALAAPHGVDRYLELIRPGWSINELRAEITAVHHPAPDSVTQGSSSAARSRSTASSVRAATRPPPRPTVAMA